MASDVFTTSKSDEESTLTGTPSGSVSASDVASGSEESSGSALANSKRLNEATTSGYDEAKCSESALAPRMISLHRFMTSITGGASMVSIRSTGAPRC